VCARVCAYVRLLLLRRCCPSRFPRRFTSVPSTPHSPPPPVATASTRVCALAGHAANVVLMCAPLVYPVRHNRSAPRRDWT
jgi:hypothetical protein